MYNMDMDVVKYNYLKEKITQSDLRLADSKFGWIDPAGKLHIEWGSEDELCDQDGFDKRHRPDKDKESYVIDDYVIPHGTIICRYGSPIGRFTTLRGTEYENLALPYVKETIEYHEYKVTEDLRVECCVIKGIVAPKFNSNGGAIQFKHKQNIALECEDGYLKEKMI